MCPHIFEQEAEHFGMYASGYVLSNLYYYPRLLQLLRQAIIMRSRSIVGIYMRVSFT